mgnify:FL=1
METLTSCSGRCETTCNPWSKLSWSKLARSKLTRSLPKGRTKLLSERRKSPIKLAIIVIWIHDYTLLYQHSYLYIMLTEKYQLP